MLFEDAKDMYMLHSISPELTCTCDEFHTCQQCHEEMKNEPTPNAVKEDGKKMWEIKGYRIWADTYQQALELLPLIESF